jgi:hypothetical protein
MHSGRCLVNVLAETQGKRSGTPLVVAEAVPYKGRWVFTNFHHGESKNSEDENLLDLLARLKNARKNATK